MRFQLFGATALVVMGILLDGCSSANYKPPITSFQASVQHGSEAVGTYFTEMNRFEREVYIDDVAFHPERDAAVAEVRNGIRTPTALAGTTFAARSVQARIDALRLVGLYAQGLADLAGTQAPTAFGDSAKTFGEQAAAAFTTLGDDTAAKYVGPLTAIAGELGKNYIESERDRMLKASITAAAAPVRAVLDQLQEDLSNAVTPLRDTGLDQMLSNSITEYNKTRSTMDLTQRRAALEAISRTYDRREAGLVADPASFIRNMRAAFDRLVQYAQSGHRPEDLASLMECLSSLEAEAGRVHAAAEEIRAVRKGS